MATYKNTSAGARAIHLTTGSYVLVEAGRTIEVDSEKVRRLAPDIVEADGEVAEAPASLKKKAAKVGKAPKAPANPLTALRREYKAKLGKNPSPGWDAATLREKIGAA